MESIEFMQESTFRKGSPMNEIQVGPLKVKYMGESQTMAVPMSGGGAVPWAQPNTRTPDVWARVGGELVGRG